MEELADILEVFLAVLHIKNTAWEDLEKIRKEKLDCRGSFGKGILLKNVIQEK